MNKGEREGSVKLSKEASNTYNCVMLAVNFFPLGNCFDRWCDHPEYPFHDEY